MEQARRGRRIPRVQFGRHYCKQAGVKAPKGSGIAASAGVLQGILEAIAQVSNVAGTPFHFSPPPIFSRNSSSSSTSTPSDFAFASLLPASFPAIKKLVFLLTLPLARPPNFTIIASISSRL